MKRGKVKQQLRIALALTISGVLVLKSSRALAQSNIVPDGTLGNERSTVIPNFQGLPVEEITGGATRGANLFHSFQEFNVSAGRRAYFFSPNATIQNILARVTGNNPSRILGTLGTAGNSNPNLFLINPNGIIFGQNARLDVGGSFLASTGTFQLTTPGVDPSRGLVNLPTQITDASRQIVQNCRASRTPEGEENKFIITGRGGLPPSPNDPLQNDEVITHWVTLDSDIPKKNNITPESVTPSRPLPTQLVEAQGWIVNEKGQIVLTASSPTVTPQSEWFKQALCNTRQNARVPNARGNGTDSYAPA